MKKIVVVGGGFAGVKVVRELSGMPGIHITLISDELDLRYSPALWRTATGGLKRESSIPIMDLVEHVPSGELVQAKIAKIDRDKKVLTDEDGNEYEYDFCVLALGVVTSYFGIPGLDTFSYSIKSAHEVERLKRHLHEQLIEDHSLDKNYVIVGAGPTGVELAAALGQYLKRIGRRHKTRSDKVKIELVEAADRVLPMMSERASRIAHKRLKRLGIRVMTDDKVEGETKNTLKVDDRSIATHTVIWTAGVTNNPFFKANAKEFIINERGKITVDDYLLVDDSVFVIGDNAAVPYSGLALTAIHHAKYVARSLKSLLVDEKMPPPIKHLDPISAVPLGNHSAIVQYKNIAFDGILGGIVRGLGDLVGYADIMGYGNAIALWTKRDEYEETCPVCSAPQVTP